MGLYGKHGNQIVFGTKRVVPNVPPALWIGLMLLGLIGIGGMAVGKKKQEISDLLGGGCFRLLAF